MVRSVLAKEIRRASFYVYLPKAAADEIEGTLLDLRPMQRVAAPLLSVDLPALFRPTTIVLGTKDNACILVKAFVISELYELEH